MSWYPIFRLGPLGSELDFPCRIVEVNVEENNVELSQRNLSGALLKSYLRQNVPMITLQLALIPDSLVKILRGFQSSLSPLNFILNSSLAVKYLPATSQDQSTIVIPFTSASGIIITGVFNRADVTQMLTNFFPGGSFNSSTMTITTGTLLPVGNTDVWVNYSFTGLSCWIKVNLKPHKGVYSGYWEGTLTLTGA